MNYCFQQLTAILIRLIFLFIDITFCIAAESLHLSIFFWSFYVCIVIVSMKQIKKYDHCTCLLSISSTGRNAIILQYLEVIQFSKISNIRIWFFCYGFLKITFNWLLLVSIPIFRLQKISHFLLFQISRFLYFLTFFYSFSILLDIHYWFKN